ncbi:MAG: A/G-specific adenine glycosylase [Gemmatimonadota bacterium]
MATHGDRGDPSACGPEAAPAGPDPVRIRSRLLDFYAREGRDLPWRRDADDPYRVWVSEVMLQQTRVETAIPYYERWFERFPDLDALADADEADVLKVWEGLGYYRRARNLHRAAQVVRERHAGELPPDPAELKRLPGIGEYTAGAVASIVYGVPAPAVDGNVRRVLSRLYDLEAPTAAALRDRAAALVPDDRPGDFNQALMEFGATVCVPRAPRCDDCPIADDCLARARKTVAERPKPKASKPLPEDDVGTAVVVSLDGRLLLARRPPDGLLGGMWEFPGAVVRESESTVDAARRAAAQVLELGASAGAAADTTDIATFTAEPLGTVSHTFSHRRHMYHAYRFRLDASRTPGTTSEAVWTAPDALGDYAMPKAQRRLAKLVT